MKNYPLKLYTIFMVQSDDILLLTHLRIIDHFHNEQVFEKRSFHVFQISHTSDQPSQGFKL